MFVFVSCSCRPCAVVAVVRSSGMVAVCLAEPPDVKNVRLERPWLSLFIFLIAM